MFFYFSHFFYLIAKVLQSKHQALPTPFIAAIKEAIPVFAKRLSSFNYPDAILTGVETRTSSPVRLPRDKSYQSINTKGLYPAGEGAGYAGGILSAAIDGVKAAEAFLRNSRRSFEDWSVVEGC